MLTGSAKLVRPYRPWFSRYGSMNIDGWYTLSTSVTDGVRADDYFAVVTVCTSATTTNSAIEVDFGTRTVRLPLQNTGQQGAFEQFTFPVRVDSDTLRIKSPLSFLSAQFVTIELRMMDTFND